MRRLNFGLINISDDLLKKINTARLLKIFNKTRKMCLLEQNYAGLNWESSNSLLTKLYLRYKDELSRREHIPKK